jgi:hypothetical protein
MEVGPMTHQDVDFTNQPAIADAVAVSRRRLLQRCGAALLAPLALSTSAGTASAANGWGAPPAADSAIDVRYCLAVCARSDREYASAGETAYQRNLAAVETRYQQRLACCPEEEGAAAAYQAACDQERAELLEIAHASHRDWFARREERLTKLLRSCGVSEGY